MPFNKLTWSLAIECGMPFYGALPSMQRSFAYDYFKCGNGVKRSIGFIFRIAETERASGHEDASVLLEVWAALAWGAVIGRDSREVATESRSLAALLRGVPSDVNVEEFAVASAALLHVANPMSYMENRHDLAEIADGIRRAAVSLASADTWSSADAQRLGCWAPHFRTLRDSRLRLQLADALDVAAATFETRSGRA